MSRRQVFLIYLRYEQGHHPHLVILNMPFFFSYECALFQLTMEAIREDIIELMSKLPGFGISPTDVELVGFYLKKKLKGEYVDCSSAPIIPELDVIKFDPWDLPGKTALESEREWFYFNTGVRKFAGYTRKTEHGYWMQIGTERLIRPNPSSNPIGKKRTMVFFTGRAPKGVRTLWIMHELSMIDHPKDSMCVCRLLKNKDSNLKDPIPNPNSSTVDFAVDQTLSKDSDETIHDTVSAFDVLCSILGR